MWCDGESTTRPQPDGIRHQWLTHAGCYTCSGNDHERRCAGAHDAKHDVAADDCTGNVRADDNGAKQLSFRWGYVAAFTCTDVERLSDDDTR